MQLNTKLYKFEYVLSNFDFGSKFEMHYRGPGNALQGVKAITRTACAVNKNERRSYMSPANKLGVRGQMKILGDPG
jgi:hypothetical protein